MIEDVSVPVPVSITESLDDSEDVPDEVGDDGVGEEDEFNVEEFSGFCNSGFSTSFSFCSARICSSSSSRSDKRSLSVMTKYK